MGALCPSSVVHKQNLAHSARTMYFFKMSLHRTASTLLYEYIMLKYYIVVVVAGPPITAIFHLAN